MIGQHGVALAGLAGVMMSWAPVQARPAHQDALDLRAGLTSASPAIEARRDMTTGMPFANSLSANDRRSLDNVVHHGATGSIGIVDIAVSTDRMRSQPLWDDQRVDMDRWLLRSIGFSAGIDLSDELTLVTDGTYARMKRRLQIVEVTPRRLSTAMARVGLGLIFEDTGRLSLDYVSVRRASRQDNFVRLAERLGGAPLTGDGPELSFATEGGETSGSTGWRLSLASMMRPERDLGYASDRMRRDARVMAGFTLKL